MNRSSILNHDEFIRTQVLRGIALNRVPGYHFCGNFFDLTFNDVYNGRSQVSIKSAPHVVGNDGLIAPIPLAVVADFAAATAIRTADDPSARLATVSLHMQITNEPMAGDIVAHAVLDGFFQGAKGRLGLSRFHIECNSKLVAFGTGTFMILTPPGGKRLAPIAWINNPPGHTPLPEVAELDHDERFIYDRAQRALESSRANGTAFLSEFLNIRIQSMDRTSRAEMENGPHIGNRVGHVQGGISMGLAMESANATLPAEWGLVGVTASYVSPGEGDVLTAHSEIIHKGRLTAVVSTKLIGIEGRLMLEVTTNHARRQDGEAAPAIENVGTV